MEKKEKKSRLAGIPAWALSLMTLFAISILFGILEDPKSPGFSTIQIIGYTFCTILNTVACYIICRIHPKSIWYTPVICSVVSIMAIIMYLLTNLSTLSELIFWVGYFILSVFGAILGSVIGRSRLIKQNN